MTEEEQFHADCVEIMKIFKEKFRPVVAMHAACAITAELIIACTGKEKEAEATANRFHRNLKTSIKKFFQSKKKIRIVEND